MLVLNAQTGVILEFPNLRVDVVVETYLRRLGKAPGCPAGQIYVVQGHCGWPSSVCKWAGCDAGCSRWRPGGIRRDRFRRTHPLV